MSLINSVGSVSSSFKITFKDSFYTDSGVKISKSGTQGHQSKMDYIGVGTGKYYMEVEQLSNTVGNNASSAYVLEATNEGTPPYRNQNVDLLLTNITKETASAVLNAGDRSWGHVISGNSTGTLRIHDSDTVQNYTGTIIISDYLDNISEPASNAQDLQGVTLSGHLELESGSIVTGDDVTFTGTGAVIRVNNTENTSLTTTLTLTNVVAPSGTQITANDATNVTVTINGGVKTLPYTFP